MSSKVDIPRSYPHDLRGARHPYTQALWAIRQQTTGIRPISITFLDALRGHIYRRCSVTPLYHSPGHPWR